MAPKMKSFLSCLVLVASVVNAQLASTGFSLAYNDIYYYVSPHAVGNMSVDVAALRWIEPDLAATVANFSQTDDVYSDLFASTMVYAGAETGTSGDFRTLALESTSLPSGPYFLEASTGMLYETYRLYSDHTGAFIASLLQSPEGTFSPLSAQIPGADALSIGVPSRLYSTKTAEKPLAGVRIAVKDIFDVAGMKTGCGSRAYYSLYPEANATGVAMQRLLDAGAVFVGKTKTSQFANGESATADWVDYHSPFNPRGDGYQQTSSSSAGSGSAMGTYEWLDLAIGSDTGGSIRGPSSAQGLFGNRPSHGLVELTGVMPLAGALDTAGFLTRDPYIWNAAQAVMYAENYVQPTNKTYPKKVQLYTGYPKNASASNASEILVGFADKLADFLGAETLDFNITSAWEDTHPEGVPDSLAAFANLTYAALIGKNQTGLLRDRFYEDYAAAHDGRTPFVNPSPRIRWAWADTQDDSIFDEALTNKTIFMDWFNSEVVPATNDSACSDSLMLYVGATGGDGSLTPRDTYFTAPGTSFYSNASNHEEYLPVAVEVIAAKGCDGMLTSLAIDLVEAGIITIPKPGQTLADGGEILVRRELDN
ncbi:Amidase 1 [Cyphellophora attinorum]|uniref:Amidase 1 n=1 Tax=Cyphellophora attinorum TaxID=1664694 RepID=A0A0N0NQ73_9EURO|nr:Amidase 1 [Phialophora attinorum]KPI43369.1 Amidase 1 [Phialophora attinorum]